MLTNWLQSSGSIELDLEIVKTNESEFWNAINNEARGKRANFEANRNQKWIFVTKTIERETAWPTPSTAMICNHRVRLKEQLFLDGDKPSLLETIFKYLANNLNLISQLNPTTQKWELKEDVIIPNEICDRWVSSAEIWDSPRVDKEIASFWWRCVASREAGESCAVSEGAGDSKTVSREGICTKAHAQRVACGSWSEEEFLEVKFNRACS